MSARPGSEKGGQRLSRAVRSRQNPIKEVAKTIKEHLWGILNAIVLKVSNGPAEGINRRIITIKVRSRGFRNKTRFANAIYFHPGGLNLYPEGVVRRKLPTRSGEEPILWAYGTGQVISNITHVYSLSRWLASPSWLHLVD